MTPFILSRSPSPVPREESQISQDEDHVSIPFAPHPSTDVDMVKDRPHLSIFLDAPYVCLKGTGNDVELAPLSGHVLLYLSHPTSVKQVSLTFKGKARVPVAHHEHLHLNNSLISYTVCNYECSFLEGDQKHSRTLKAGHHYFPFQLQLGGSLPSSLETTTLNGASITYKLRAQVIRPGFGHNLHAYIPVTVLHTFVQESLEYQQTLEIENTWPDKVMYLLMLPHKAWAAGDRLTTVAKFSPLRKGVRILGIRSSIHETIKLHGKAPHEHTKIVAIANHHFIDGKAVEEDVLAHCATTTWPNSHSAPSRDSSTQSIPSSSRSPPPANHSLFSALAFRTTTIQQESAPRSPVEDALGGADDVVATISFPIPLTITPTHAHEPILVRHRIRWSIYISNPDGHISKLRCSLPVHILDGRLLEESKRFTAPTRRLVLGEVQALEQEEEDQTLPSYRSHVRDRIADMYLPEAATIRIANPCLLNSGNSNHNSLYSGMASPGSASRSGYSTPMDSQLDSHLPHTPGSGDSTPLDWVNSELFLSLHSERPLRYPMAHLHSHSDAVSDSPPGSRTHSRQSSRFPSRATSPVRQPSQVVDHPPGLPLPAVASPNDSYVHTSHVDRHWNAILHAPLKPLTSASHNWLPLSLHSHTTAQQPFQQLHDSRPMIMIPHSLAMTPNISLSDPSTASALYQRAMGEVPGYEVTVHGFIGGVAPLESMQGLPSYEEAELS